MLKDTTQCLRWVLNLGDPSASCLRLKYQLSILSFHCLLRLIINGQGQIFFGHYEQSIRFTVGLAVGLADMSFLVVKKSHCNN